MFFEEMDNRNPRERVDSNLLRQIMNDQNGGHDYRSRHVSMTRSGRNIAEAGGDKTGCGCGRRGDEHHDDERYGDEHHGDDKYDWKDQDAGRRTWGLCGYPLGSVYAPLQEWRGIYDLETGLDRGTIFRELDKPWYGSGGTRGGYCRG